jgi:predicted RNA methylase
VAKLSKAEIKRHREACELLSLDTLTLDQREFIIENWNEGAEHNNAAAGAFFTPLGLAFDLALEVSGKRILDLCAGISGLSYAAYWHGRRHNDRPEITCVEFNPGYVEVGRKVMPEARWITANVMDLPDDLGEFDCVITNPPFGRNIKISTDRYSGEADLAVIDIASRFAPYCVAIVPAGSAPFRYSGARYYEWAPGPKYQRFHKATGISLQAGCGVDTSYYRDQWRGTSPATEIVIADFEGEE